MKSKIKNIIMISILLLALVLIFAPKSFARVDADGNEIIEFEDEYIKNSIIYRLDTNNDGEISVSEIKQLDAFEIYYNGVDVTTNETNIEFLNYAENLNKISIYNYSGKNLNLFNSLNETTKDKIQYMTISTSLRVNGEEIALSDISAIKEFSNLKELGITGIYHYEYSSGTTTPSRSEEYELDVSPLQKLTQLSRLTLANMNISDISCLNALTELTYLNISDNNINDIDVISNFTKLREIFASNNKITNVDVISNLKNLSFIYFTDNKIKKIPDLSTITAFTERSMSGSMYFSNNEIEDISGLANIYIDNNFVLSNNKIKDISPLLEIKNTYISYFDLSNNLLDESCINVISQLPELGIVRLNDNNISGTVTLSKVNAREIWLHENLIETINIDGNNKIEDLGAYNNKNLKTVSITNTNLLHYIRLYDNPQLENVTINNINSNGWDIFIDLYSCNISDLSGLSNIANENLKKNILLNLNNNKIEDMSPLASNLHLSSILLIDNNINPYTEQAKFIIYALAENGCTDLQFGDCSRFLTQDIVKEDVETDEVEVNGEKVTILPTETKTNIEDFIKNTFVENEYEIEIKNKNGDIVTSGKIGSRSIITIKNEAGDVITEYTVVVPGDITGNGYSRMYDAFLILKDSINSKQIDAIEIKIRDFNGDEKVRMYDAFQFLKKAILGK